MATDTPPARDVDFQRHPDAYLHWKLTVDGDTARLSMNVQERGGIDPDTVLKQNSYDLSVDVELADAVQRLRFEHPRVRCLVIDSAISRVFCAGANIPMLRGSTHSFKVNFCKFTNETRLYLEDASRHSGIKSLAALNGTAAGGGYELALACDWVILPDDGNTAVSFPEVPLLGVLPGTGGLTRLVDKRMVRRDLADVFSTVAEGIKGRRAKKWNLVDEVVPSSKFAAAVEARARVMADASAAERPEREDQTGVPLPTVEFRREDDKLVWTYVTLDVHRADRTADLTLTLPESCPCGIAEIRNQGANWWLLQAFRELDEALLHLRFNLREIGTVVLRVEGDQAVALDTDGMLTEFAGDWFVTEVRHLVKRVLKRLDLTARTFFAFIEPGSAFVGTLYELALACDRIYMLDDPDRPNALQLTDLNAGGYPMSNGISRLETRFLGSPQTLDAVLAHAGKFDALAAEENGLVTYAPDDIDWEDEVRLAIEERASISPDALTGMEANLRFAGPETMETKIFGRLSAWQNWIFQRPNAVGERGALTAYGEPLRPVFDWTRT